MVCDLCDPEHEGAWRHHRSKPEKSSHRHASSGSSDLETVEASDHRLARTLANYHSVNEDGYFRLAATVAAYNPEEVTQRSVST